MTKKEIAEILKKARIKAKLTQKQAAEKVGKKQQTLASWETGQSQPDANTLFSLFEVYGQSIDEAFGFYSSNTKSSDDEKKLLFAFKMLNKDGQRKVLEYIDDLVASDRYKKGSGKILSLEKWRRQRRFT